MKSKTCRNTAIRTVCFLPIFLGACTTAGSVKPSNVSYFSYEYPIEIDLQRFHSDPVFLASGEEVVLAEGPTRVNGAQQTVADVTIERNGTPFATLPAGTLLTKIDIYRAADPYPGIVAAVIVAQLEKNGQTREIPKTDIYCGTLAGSDAYPTACFVDRDRDKLMDTIMVGDIGGGDALSSAVLPIGTIRGKSVDFIPFAIRPAEDGVYTEARMRVVAEWNGEKTVRCTMEYYPMQNDHAHVLPFDRAKAVFNSLNFDTTRVRLSDSKPNLAVFQNAVAAQFKQDHAASTVTGQLLPLDGKIGGTMRMNYAR